MITNRIFIMMLMLQMHVIDDYYLQGILANLKQKDWWRKQKGYRDLYRHDWIPALLAHAFSWTFMVMLPLAFYFNFNLSAEFLILFGFNWIVHAVIDHLKANVRCIDLVTDQTIHVIMILVTARYLLFM